MEKMKEGDKIKKTKIKKTKIKKKSYKQNKEIIDILEASTLEKLAISLGLEETEEMVKLRKKTIKLIFNRRLYVHDFLKYESLAKNNLNKKNRDHTKGKIAIELMNASMYYDGGNIEYAKSSISNAISISHQMHFYNISETIKKIMETKE